MNDNDSGFDFNPGLNNSIDKSEDKVDEVEDAIEIEEEKSEDEEKAVQNANYKTYECSKCHTVFSIQGMANVCIYCGGTITQKNNSDFSSYEMIPFKLSLNDAFNVFKKMVMKHPLAPFAMRGNSLKKKIKKIYIPATLCDLVLDGNIDFTGSDRVQNIKGSPTQFFECNYSVNVEYKNVLTSRYLRITDTALSNINNYSFSNKIGFQDDAWKDAYLINSNSVDEEILEKVKEKGIKFTSGIVKQSVKHLYKKVNNNSLNPTFSSVSNIFVPAYIVRYTDQGKEYLYIINGQSGEVIGDIPIGIESIIILSVILFIVILGISALIGYFI